MPVVAIGEVARKHNIVYLLDACQSVGQIPVDVQARQRIQHLAFLFRQRLRELEGIVVYDQGDELCGIVTFSIPGIPAAEVKSKLAAKNINVHIGFAQSTLYYMNRKGLDGIVRASVHYYNTEEEIELVCQELRALCNSCTP